MAPLFLFSLFGRNSSPNTRKNLSLGVSMLEAILTFPIFFFFVVFLIDCARFFLVLTVMNYACFRGADFASKVEVEADTTIGRCVTASPGDPQSCYDYYERVQRVLQRTLDFALLVASDSQTPSSSRLIRFRHYNPTLYPASTKNASGIRPSGSSPAYIDSDVAYLRPGEAVERLGGTGGTFHHPLRPLGTTAWEGWPDPAAAESWDTLLKQIPFVVHAEVDFDFFLPVLQNVTIQSNQYGFRRTGARGVQGPPLQGTSTPVFSPTRTATKTRSPTITPTPAVTRTPTATRTPTITITRTVTGTATGSATVTPTRTGTGTRTPTRTSMPSPTLNCGYCETGPDWYTSNQAIANGSQWHNSCVYCNANCGRPCWDWPGCPALCLAYYGGNVFQCASAGDNCVAPTRTPTQSRTATITITGTISTATRTATRTRTRTPTVTSTPTITNTPQATRTRTPSPTITSTYATHTATRTLTPAITRTATRTGTRTNTPLPTGTRTPTRTATPIQTITNTPIPTGTNTPTRTVTPIPTATPTPTDTVPPPPTMTPTIDTGGGG